MHDDAFSIEREQGHLEKTQSFIDQHHDDLEKALNSVDVAGQRKVIESRNRNYQDVREIPFFSVVLNLAKNDQELIRLGRHAIHDPQSNLLVASWTSEEGREYAQLERQSNNEIYGAIVEINRSKVVAVIETNSSKAEKRRERILSPKSADLKDVIDLVSPEQDDVVRLEHVGGLVISGGPGTGKTVVGLQRIAYKLLQSEGTLLQDKRILVIGPSESYINYVREFFPRLGLNQVENRNITRICAELIPNNASQELIDLRIESDGVKRTKNSIDFCRVVQEGIWPLEVKASINATVEIGLNKRISRLLSEAEISEVFTNTRAQFISGEISYRQARMNMETIVQKLLTNPDEDVSKTQARTHDGQRKDLFDRWLLRIGMHSQEARQSLMAVLGTPSGGRHLRAMSAILNEFYKDDIERAIDSIAHLPRFDFSEMRRWLEENQAKKKTEINKTKQSNDESSIAFTAMNITFNQIVNLKPDEILEDVARFVDKLLPRQELLSVSRRICSGSDVDIFKRVLGERTGAALSARISDSASLHKKRGKYLWSDVDQVVIAAISYRLDGEFDRYRYRYVMVDEAQDLTRLELRVISNYMKAAEVSLVGDLNQATKIGYLGTWSDIAIELGLKNLKIVELQHNYRIPENIYDYARLYLDEESRIQTPTCDLDGGTVEVLAIPNRRYEDLLNQLISTKSKNGERVAVICGDEQFNMKFSQGQAKNVVFLTPEESKGLEVDHSLVLKPNSWYRPTGRLRNLMYVTLTRATKSVTIMDSGGTQSQVLDPSTGH
jgi:DNA helicase IV